MDNCCKKSLKLLKCIFLPLLLPATGPVLPTYLKDGHPTQKFWLAPNWQIGGQQTKKGDYSQIWQGTSKSRPKKQFFSRICPFPTIKPDSHLIKKQNWCSWDKFTILRISDLSVYKQSSYFWLWLAVSETVQAKKCTMQFM